MNWKAFDRCLLIFHIYPIVLYLLGWLFGGSSKVGGVFMLPDVVLWPGRLWRVALVAIMGTAIWLA